MAFFRPFITAPEPNFSGLFRLIDDFDKYSAAQSGGQDGSQIQSFTPKFDLRETETAFELHGELPGVKKEDIVIEFADPQTLVVRGRVERTHTAGDPPASLIENITRTGRITESGEDTVPAHQHKATVEETPEETSKTTASTEPKDTPAKTSTEVAKSAEKQKAAAPKHKYYMVERNIGQFSRSFTFPGHIDTESVSAGLDNGILTVTVQKAKKQAGKRITVN